MHGLVVGDLGQTDIHRFALAAGNGRHFQVLGLVQEGVLDLGAAPAKAFQVDPDMAGQVNVAHQQVEWL
ncbi:hypothetical protein D3C75_1085900 [compost metagenome]